LVGPVDHGLVEAAMLGLGQPVGAEADFVEREGLACKSHNRGAGRHADEPCPERCHVVLRLPLVATAPAVAMMFFFDGHAGFAPSASENQPSVVARGVP